MHKIKICIFLLFISSNLLFGQSACPEALDYGYWHYEVDTSGSLLTDQDFWIHYSGTGGQSSTSDNVRSPFHQPGHRPIDPLQDAPGAAKDNKVEDGWDILYHDFGWSKLDTVGEGTNPSFEHSVKDAVLILYNKYNGTLRVLYNLQETLQGEDRMALTLQFESFAQNSEWKESALLSHADSKIFAVDSFKKGNILSSVSEVINATKRWYFADFPLAYDPCTCTEDTRLRFKIQLVDKVELNLSGNGTIKSLIDTSSTTNKHEPKGEKSVLNSIVSTINGGVKAYNEEYGKGEKTKKLVEDFTDNIRFEQDTSGPGLTPLQKTLNSALDLGVGLAKHVPLAKGVIGAFGFLLTGGKKSSAPTSPKVSGINLEISGTLSLTNTYADFTIINPNSTRADSSLHEWEDLPKTKHTLGICNLLESPVVEWVPILSRGNGAAVPNSVSAPDHSNALRHYNVQTPIRFVVNPATELELIELNAAMLLEYPPGAYIDPTFPSGCGLPANNVSGGPLRRDREDIFEQLAFHGLEVEAWPKAYPLDTAFVTTEADGPLILRTPYYHASCFDEISFMIHDTAQGFAAPTVIPEVYCKLQARLRRTDTLADDSTKDVIYIATYNVDLRRAFNGLPYGQCDTCSFFYGNSPDSVPPTAHTEVVYRTFFRDTTVHDDSLIIAGDKPWKLPWSDYFPGFFRSIALESE